MKRADIFVFFTVAILFFTIAVDFAVQQNKKQDASTKAYVETKHIDEPAKDAPPDPQALAAVKKDYLKIWGKSGGSLVPMLKIDEAHTVYYRRVWTNITGTPGKPDERNDKFGHRIDLFLHDSETDMFTSIMNKVSDGQPFVRNLENEYGIILDDEMLVFSKATYLPLRLEPAPKLIPSDLISPDYLKKWDNTWSSNIGYSYPCGELSPGYAIYSKEVMGWDYMSGIGQMDGFDQIFLENKATGTSTPLFAGTCESLQKLADGRYMLRGSYNWVLVFDPSTNEAVELYRSMDELGEKEWNPVASCPYKSGRVELGAVSSANGGLVYGIDIYDYATATPKRINTDIPFYSTQFAENRTPELHIYDNRLMFLSEENVVSISLINGEIETGPKYETYFKDNIAICVTNQPIPDESLESWELKALITVYLWPDGKLSEQYAFEAPEPLISYGGFEDRAIKDMEYDLKENKLTIYQIGWKHIINLDTYEIITEDDFPVPPYSVYAISSDGRYTVASTYLGGGGDGHAEEVYLIDNETGKTKSLGLVGGGYGHWGVADISENIVSVTNRDTRFYDLATGEKLPLTLPENDSEHTIGVVYDISTRRYIRAVCPHGYDKTIEERKDYTIRFDCFDDYGVLRQTWRTDAKPGYAKFAAPMDIRLTMYDGKALFMDYEQHNYFGDLPVAIAMLDPKSGEVTRIEGNAFTVSDGFLFTVSYNISESDSDIESYILRKYKGGSLLSEQTVKYNGDRYASTISFLEYDIKTQTLIGWYEYFEREVIFEAKFTD